MFSRFDSAAFTASRLVAGLPFQFGSTHPEALLRYLRSLPPGLLTALRRSAFRRTLRWADSRSSFYRQKFSDHGIDVKRARGPEDLGEFYLSTEELRQFPEALLCAKADLAIESSGTTGHAARIFMNQSELDYSARQGSRSIWPGGLDGIDYPTFQCTACRNIDVRGSALARDGKSNRCDRETNQTRVSERS